jgi:hypothetical protein
MIQFTGDPFLVAAATKFAVAFIGSVPTVMTCDGRNDQPISRCTMFLMNL